MPRKLNRPATAAQAAEHFGVHLRTIRRWIARGDLPAYRVGPRLVRVDLDDVDRLARRMATAPARRAS